MAENTKAKAFGAGVRFFIDKAGETVSTLSTIMQSFRGVKEETIEADRRASEFGVGLISYKERFEALAAESGKLEGAGKRILMGMYSQGRELAQAGGTLLETRKQFELAFKDADTAAVKLRAAMDVAASTNLETIGTMKMVTDFQRKSVDALKMYNGEWMQNGKMVKGQIPTLQLVNDLISGSGQDMHNVFRNMNLALSGTLVNYRALFDHNQTKAEEAMYKKAKNAQERMDAIVATTLRLYGGISKTTEGTFNFLMDNIDDVSNILKATIGERILPAVTPLVQRLFNMLDAMAKNEKFLAAMTGGVELLANIFVPVASAVMDVIDAIVRMAGEYPNLVKFGMVITMITGGLLLAAGLIGGVLATIGLFATVVLPSIVSGFAVVSSGMAMVTGMITRLQSGLFRIHTFVIPVLRMGLALLSKAFIGVFMTVLPFVLVLLGKFILMSIVIRTVREVFEKHFKGIGGLFNNLSLGVRGLIEIISNWANGTSTMSKKTAMALKNAGIYEWVVKIGGWIGSVIDWFRQLWGEIQGAVVQISDALVPVFTELFGAFGDIADAIGEVFQSLGLAGPTLTGTTKSIGTAKAIIQGVVTIIQFLARAIVYVLQIWRTYFIPTVKFVVGLVWAFGVAMVNAGKAIGRFFVSVWNAMVSVATAIRNFFVATYNIVTGTVRAIYQGAVYVIGLVVGFFKKVWAAVSAVGAAIYGVVYKYFVSPFVWWYTRIVIPVSKFVFNVFLGLARYLMQVFVGLAKMWWKFYQAAYAVFSKIVTAAYQGFMLVVGTIYYFLKMIYDYVVEVFSAVASKIYDYIVWAKDKVVSAVTAMWDAFKAGVAFVAGVMLTIYNTVVDMWTAAKDMALSVFGMIWNALYTYVVDPIMNAFGVIASVISTVFVEALNAAWEQMKSWWTTLVDTVWTPFKDTIMWIVEKIQWIIDKIPEIDLSNVLPSRDDIFGAFDAINPFAEGGTFDTSSGDSDYPAASEVSINRLAAANAALPADHPFAGTVQRLLAEQQKANAQQDAQNKALRGTLTKLAENMGSENLSRSLSHALSQNSDIDSKG